MYSRRMSSEECGRSASEESNEKSCFSESERSDVTQIFEGVVEVHHARRAACWH